MAACFVDLGTRSLWNDEIHSTLIALHHGTSLWSAITADSGNMLLYYLLLHIFVSLFGDGQFVLRVPTALAGIALTPVIFFLGRRMFGSRTAAIAAAIVAVSPALVVWNQQARGYPLGTLLISSSLLVLLRAIEHPTRRRWGAYGLVVLLSIYTLDYAALFLIAQWLGLAFWPQARQQARPILTVVGIAALAYVPLIVLVLRPGAIGLLSYNAPPSTGEGVRIFEELASGVAPDFFATTWIAGIVTAVALLCWVAAGAELVSRIRSAPGELETVCLGVAMSWLLLPLLLDTIFSIAFSSIFDPSFLLQSVPAGAILVAFVFGKLMPKRLPYVFAFGFVALLVAALVPTYGVSFEQWAQVSRYVSTASRPGDCLTVSKAELASSLAYYFSREGDTGTDPQLVLPARTWLNALDPTLSAPSSNERFAIVALTCERLWIILSRVSPGQFVGIDSEVNWFYGHGFKHVTVSHFVPQNGFGIDVTILAR